MDEHGFENLDIRFEKIGRSYRVVVIDSPMGEGITGSFRNPVEALELENLALLMSRSTASTRHVDSPSEERVRDIGRRLFDALFRDELLTCLKQSLHEVDRYDRGLRIRLRLGETPQLADLPWELLYDSRLNRFVSLSDRTPVVRYLEIPERSRPLQIEGPLRVLVVVSSPSDYARLDVDAEWARLEDALGPLEAAGALSVTRLPDATLGALRRELRRGSYHVLHYIGHGGFARDQDEGVLVFTGGDGTGALVGGESLGIELHDAKFRLVVLNACEGARASTQNPFAGVAQSLVQHGIPAVVAMQFPVTDAAAIAFAEEFYGSLVDGLPVDAAMGQGRRAVREVSPIEWGTPVLLLRGADGRLFDVAPPGADRRARPTRIEREPEAGMATDEPADERDDAVRREPESRAALDAGSTTEWRAGVPIGKGQWTRGAGRLILLPDRLAFEPDLSSRLLAQPWQIGLDDIEGVEGDSRLVSIIRITTRDGTEKRMSVYARGFHASGSSVHREERDAAVRRISAALRHD